jgi:BMFP domain-containing protein YqiC
MAKRGKETIPRVAGKLWRAECKVNGGNPAMPARLATHRRGTHSIRGVGGLSGPPPPAEYEMSDNRSGRIADEFAKLFNDAANVAQGVKREAETLFRSQAERFIADMDLVKREDFDAVREMAARARAENERLAARVAALEARLGISSEDSADETPIGAMGDSPVGPSED